MGRGRPPTEAILLVAIEYEGVDLPPLTGGRRRPLREHVYDLRGQQLAGHPREWLRVGFPEPRRGWPSQPVAARCARCEESVTILVGGLISEAVQDLREPNVIKAGLLAGLIWLRPHPTAERGAVRGTPEDS